MKKTKLLIFIHSLGAGGAERITTLLAQEFQNRYEVHIALLEPTVSYPIPSDIPIHVLGSHSDGTLSKLLGMVHTLIACLSLLKQLEIKIVMATLNRPIFIAAVGKMINPRFRLVITEHTLQSRWRSEEKLFSFFKKMAIKVLFNQADAIIAVSKGIKHDLITNFALDSNKITTIYNPFDLDSIRKEAANKLLFPLSPTHGIRIVTAGTLKPLKNHSLLIHAMTHIPKEHSLLLLGDGELHSTLHKQINELGLVNRILMPGFISNPYPYFSQSQIFVLTSIFEGLPTVIIEAMACGCAIISTDCPTGPREILAPDSQSLDFTSGSIELAEFGILVPTNDVSTLSLAINTLINNPDLLKHYQRKALQRAEDFDKNIQMPLYINVLDQKAKIL